MATTNISIRMDSELKAQAEALFSELGMNLSTAFNVFVRQSLRDGGIPFEIKMDQPNKETMAAMLEAPEIHRRRQYKRDSQLCCVCRRCFCRGSLCACDSCGLRAQCALIISD